MEFWVFWDSFIVLLVVDGASRFSDYKYNSKHYFTWLFNNNKIQASYLDQSHLVSKCN